MYIVVLCSSDAIEYKNFVVLAMVRLCDRVWVRFYLAVPRRSGRYPFELLDRQGQLDCWECV